MDDADIYVQIIQDVFTDEIFLISASIVLVFICIALLLCCICHCKVNGEKKPLQKVESHGSNSNYEVIMAYKTNSRSFSDIKMMTDIHIMQCIQNGKRFSYKDRFSDSFFLFLLLM